MKLILNALDEPVGLEVQHCYAAHDQLVRIALPLPEELFWLVAELHKFVWFGPPVDARSLSRAA